MESILQKVKHFKLLRCDITYVHSKDVDSKSADTGQYADELKKISKKLRIKFQKH